MKRNKMNEFTKETEWNSFENVRQSDEKQNGSNRFLWTEKKKNTNFHVCFMYYYISDANERKMMNINN